MTKSKKSNNKGFAKCQPEDHPFAQQYNKRMEECGGDFLEYQRRYNRHTLRISLTDEQVGKELLGDKEITFYNEDNAICHLSFLSDLLDLLVQEENRWWGCGKSDDALVERITCFVKERVSQPEGYVEGGDNLVPLTKIVDDLKKEVSND